MKFKKIDDKVTKNSSEILGFKSTVEHKDVINDLKRDASFNGGNYYYNQQSYFLFEPKSKSYNRNGGVANFWISTGIYIDSRNTDLFPANNSNSVLPKLINQNNRLGVLFEGNYMKQSKIGYAHGSGLNIYIVYKLQKRTVNNPDFTIQNSLFGAIKITKDVNTSHYQCHGYGICFDPKSDFRIGNITNGKNVIIFGADIF